MARAPVVHMTQAEKKARQKLEKQKQMDAEEKAMAARKDARANAERGRLLERAGPDRKVKMAIASMTRALWKFELTAQQRLDIRTKIAQYEKDLLTMGAIAVDEQTLEIHMKFLSSSPELVQVMRTLWVCMLPYVKNGSISKEGYIKLTVCLQYCLNGSPSEDTAKAAAEASWEHDQVHYNKKMNQEAFYDMMYNVVTGWLDMFDTMSYCTMLWSIVDSVFDTSIYPPKFRLKRFIRCIISADNESKMMQSWFVSRHHIEDVIGRAVANAATVSLLCPGTGNGLVPAKYYSEVNEDLVRKYTYSEGDDARWVLQADPNLEMLLRHQDRQAKGQVTISDEDQSMIKAFAIKAAKEQKTEKLAKAAARRSGKKVEDDSDSDADEEERRLKMEAERLAQSMTDSLSASQEAAAPHRSSRDRSAEDNLSYLGRPQKGIKIAESFKDGRSGWLASGVGEGKEGSVSVNYSRSKLARIERSNNWIGEAKGNIFFNRGQYLKDATTITGSFTAFMHSWMDEMDMTEADVNYGMLAAIKAEWLNARSRATQSSRLQARLDDDRKHLQKLHLKSTGLGIRGFPSSIYNSASEDGLGIVSQAGSIGSFTMTEEQMRAVESINMSVKEVMTMIRELQPAKQFGESIPAPWQYTRIPDIVMVGSGEIAVESRAPFTTSDYLYAPTYVYHAPEHSERTQSIVSSIRPQHPLRRMLDGGGNYAGTSGHSSGGMHYQFGSHINSSSVLQAGLSFTDGTSIMTGSISSGAPSQVGSGKQASRTILPPARQPATRNRVGSVNSLGQGSLASQISHSQSAASAFKYDRGFSQGFDGEMDDASQWSTVIGDDHEASINGPQRAVGRHTKPGMNNMRNVVPGRYTRVHKDVLAEAAAEKAANKERLLADKSRKQASINALLLQCKKVAHIQKEDQTRLLDKLMGGKTSRSANASTGAYRGYSTGTDAGVGYGFGNGNGSAGDNEMAWSDPQTEGGGAPGRSNFALMGQMRALEAMEASHYQQQGAGHTAPRFAEGLYMPQEHTVSTPIAPEPLIPLTELSKRLIESGQNDGRESPLFLEDPDEGFVVGAKLLGGGGSPYADSWTSQVQASTRDQNMNDNASAGGDAHSVGEFSVTSRETLQSNHTGYGSQKYSMTSEQTAASRERDFLEEVMFARSRMLKQTRDKEPGASEAISARKIVKTKGPNMREKSSISTLFAPSASASMLPPSMQGRASVVVSLAQFQQKRGIDTQSAQKSSAAGGRATISPAGMDDELDLDLDLDLGEEEDMYSLGLNSVGSNSLGSSSISGARPLTIAEKQAQLAATNGSNPNGIIYGKGTGGKEYRFMDPNDIVAEKVWISQKSLTYESDKRWLLGGSIQRK